MRRATASLSIPSLAFLSLSSLPLLVGCGGGGSPGGDGPGDPARAAADSAGSDRAVSGIEADVRDPAGSDARGPDAGTADRPLAAQDDGPGAEDGGLGAESGGFGAGYEDLEESPVPLLPGEGEPREYRLLLVNLLDREAYVFASAGVWRVVLDTVPRADSLFVDIRLRADQVDLEAEDEQGSLVSAASIDLVRAAINRWEIRPTEPGRVASRGSPTPPPATMLDNSDARRPAGRRPR